MGHYNTILHQVLTLIPRHQFDGLVKTHKSDYRIRRLNTWNQFTALLYAQGSGKDSLRDIESALVAQGAKTYHVGLPSRVCRSTLADANAKRPWEVYQALFYQVLSRCRSATPKHKFKFKNPLYSLDATVIDLCLSMFPWAKYRQAKGALKLHYQYDYAGNVPCLLTITEGRYHELSVTKQEFPIVPDSIYCFDRGYLDFAWFRRLHELDCTFVTRVKKNLSYRVTGQHEKPKNQRVLADLRIERIQPYAEGDKPMPLRLIRYRDPEADHVWEYLTSNLTLSAQTIADIYKARWQIEIFFRWIKQNLKIKTFLGTSKNAVMTQIWVAMIYFLLLSYIKYQTKYRFSLFYLHKVIRSTLLDRLSLVDLLNLNDRRLAALSRGDPQLAFRF